MSSHPPPPPPLPLLRGASFSRDNSPLPPTLLKCVRKHSVLRPSVLASLQLNRAESEKIEKEGGQRKPLLLRAQSAGAATEGYAPITCSSFTPISSDVTQDSAPNEGRADSQLPPQLEIPSAANASSPASSSTSSSSTALPPEPDSPRSTNAWGWFHIFTPDEGTVISRVGHTFTWSRQHPRISHLTALRAFGDDDADEVLERLQCGFSGDCVSLMSDRAMRHVTGGAESAMLSEVERETDLICHQFMQKYSTVPEWVDWKKMERGQTVFQRTCQTSLLALMYSSLLGGFGAPLINKVLTSTNYLSGNCPATYRRLVETTLMISACTGPDISVMKCPWVDPAQTNPSDSSLTPDRTPHLGDGWLASLRVRFLHAKVRSMLRSRESWDFETYGVPINQEDMLATLLAFSFNVTFTARRAGIVCTEEEKEDYCHLWRYIGYLSGVRMDLLEWHMASHEKSLKCSESIMYHLVHPDSTSYLMAEHVLSSVHQCFPLKWSYDFHLGIARKMMTDEWADSLKLPQCSRSARWKVECLCLWLKMTAGVSSLHPKLGEIMCKTNWRILDRSLKRHTVQSASARKKQEREEATKEKIRAGPHLTAATSSSSSLPLHSSVQSKIHSNSHMFSMSAEHVPNKEDIAFSPRLLVSATTANPHSSASVSGDVSQCPFFSGVSLKNKQLVLGQAREVKGKQTLDVMELLTLAKKSAGEEEEDSDSPTLTTLSLEGKELSSPLAGQPLWSAATRPFDLMIEILSVTGVKLMVIMMLFFFMLTVVVVTGFNPVEWSYMSFHDAMPMMNEKLKDVVPTVQHHIEEYAAADPHAFLFTNIIYSVTTNLSALAASPFE